MKSIFEDTACLSMQEIKAYHAGKLRRSQLSRVERHLIDCELCNGALEGFSQSTNEKKDRAQLKILLRQTRSTQRNTTSFYLKRAAVILLLAIIGAAFLSYWNHMKGERLFARFYQKPAYTAIKLRAPQASSVAELRAKAFEAYLQEDYTKTASLFDEYLSQSTTADFEASFYAGIAHLQKGNHQTAINWLSKVRVNDINQYERASWYLALAYLQQGDYTTASLIAQELVETSNPLYREKAIGLLEAL